jgi:hypothetical protein
MLPYSSGRMICTVCNYKWMITYSSNSSRPASPARTAKTTYTLTSLAMNEDIDISAHSRILGSVCVSVGSWNQRVQLEEHTLSGVEKGEEDGDVE